MLVQPCLNTRLQTSFSTNLPLTFKTWYFGYQRPHWVNLPLAINDIQMIKCISLNKLTSISYERFLHVAVYLNIQNLVKKTDFFICNAKKWFLHQVLIFKKLSVDKHRFFNTDRLCLEWEKLFVWEQRL